MREGMREDGVAIRQPPWATFALIALLLCGYAYLRAERSQIDAELGVSLAEAGEYFRAHPYLTPPGLLASQISRAAAEQLRARYLADAAQPQRAAGPGRHPAPRAGAARRPRRRGLGPPLGASDTALGHATPGNTAR